LKITQNPNRGYNFVNKQGIKTRTHIRERERARSIGPNMDLFYPSSMLYIYIQ